MEKEGRGNQARETRGEREVDPADKVVADGLGSSSAQVQHKERSAASKEARGDEKKLDEFTQGREAFARGPHLLQTSRRASLYA